MAKQKKKYHSTVMWTKVDYYIEEVAEWMNNNLSNDNKIEVNIKIIGKDGTSIYTEERQF